MNIDYFYHVFVLLSFYHYKDPCDQLDCNGTNAVCEVVYGTGKPFCACALGFMGDPRVSCGKYVT